MDSPRTEISEPFLMEWFDFGWSELVSFLTKHARFDAWCLENEAPDTETKEDA